MKALILIRHAHRDTSNRSLDNGLSSKGLKQVKRLRSYWGCVQPEILRGAWASARFVSSPSRRCVETLHPIARQAGFVLTRDANLFEQKEGESDRTFRQRVMKFYNTWLASESPLTVVCSHGDWLPLLVWIACGVKITIKKGGWVRLVLPEGKKAPELYELIQSFKLCEKARE